MSYELRRRLVGILVLTALGLVVIPLLFDFSRGAPLDQRSQIPPARVTPNVLIEAELRPQLLEQAPLPAPVLTLAGDEAATLRGYVVQFGSYPDPEIAESKRAELHAAGYKVYLRRATVDGELTFRVLVGPLLDRGEAQSLERELNKKYAITSLLRALQ